MWLGCGDLQKLVPWPRAGSVSGTKQGSHGSVPGTESLSLDTATMSSEKKQEPPPNTIQGAIDAPTDSSSARVASDLTSVQVSLPAEEAMTVARSEPLPKGIASLRLSAQVAAKILDAIASGLNVRGRDPVLAGATWMASGGVSFLGHMLPPNTRNKATLVAYQLGNLASTGAGGTSMGSALLSATARRISATAEPSQALIHGIAALGKASNILWGTSSLPKIGVEIYKISRYAHKTPKPSPARLRLAYLQGVLRIIEELEQGNAGLLGGLGYGKGSAGTWVGASAVGLLHTAIDVLAERSSHEVPSDQVGETTV